MTAVLAIAKLGWPVLIEISGNVSGSDAEVLFGIGLLAVILAVPVGGIWLWHAASRSLSGTFRRHRSGGPLALLGSAAGVTIGTGIGVLALVVLFYLLMIYAIYMAMMIVFGAIFLRAIT